MNKKVVFRVFSVRTYRKDGDKGEETYVRIDQLLYEGDAFAEMDSTVYDIDDFKDIHEIYKANQTETLQYDYKEWDRYLAEIKRQLMSLV